MPTGGLITIETERATLDREFTETHRGARQGTYIRLSITDSSTGFDSEDLTRIFDFPQREDFDSAGLGLPIVYSIVKRFDGYVTVESSPGKGTRFNIYIPSVPPILSIAPIADDQRPRDLLPHEASIAANTSLILVADDDSDIRKTIARYVSRAGYKTVFAANGKTAFDLYKRLADEGTQPALLIADLGLPEIDGRTLSTTNSRTLSHRPHTPDWRIHNRHQCLDRRNAGGLHLPTKTIRTKCSFNRNRTNTHTREPEEFALHRITFNGHIKTTQAQQGLITPL